jgi:hypothetical protein
MDAGTPSGHRRAGWRTAPAVAMAGAGIFALLGQAGAIAGSADALENDPVTG